MEGQAFPMAVAGGGQHLHESLLSLFNMFLSPSRAFHTCHGDQNRIRKGRTQNQSLPACNKCASPGHMGTRRQTYIRRCVYKTLSLFLLLRNQPLTRGNRALAFRVENSSCGL